MSKGKAILGTLAGLAIGGIASILLAPKKGSKTREQIMDKGDDYVDKLKTKFNKSRDSLAKKIESNKKNAEELLDKEKAGNNEARKGAQNAAVNF